MCNYKCNLFYRCSLDRKIVIQHCTINGFINHDFVTRNMTSTLFAERLAEFDCSIQQSAWLEQSKPSFALRQCYFFWGKMDSTADQGMR